MRLDVQPLVGLEQLQASSDSPARSCGGPGQRSHSDAAERRHPAEALVGLEHPVALGAAVDLRPHAQLVGQVHLVPAGDPAGRHPGVEQLVGPASSV